MSNQSVSPSAQLELFPVAAPVPSMFGGLVEGNVLPVYIPEELAHYKDELLLFFTGMIYKLQLNAHKDTPTKPKIPELMFRMMGEIGELTQQIIDDKSDPNSLWETFDTANFSFLIYLALLRDGVKDPRWPLVPAPTV